MLTRYLRFLVPLGALCVGLPVMVFVLPRLLIGTPLPDSIGEHTQWHPTPDEIRTSVGIGDSPASDIRHRHFASMFQQRFRNNQKAVGISFAPDGAVTAKFAATIPRWDMASVALDLHREAKEIFGRSVNVNIYETYISMTPVKLAELREASGGNGVDVRFDPRFALEQNPVRRRPANLVAEIMYSPAAAPDNLPNPMAWMIEANMEQRRMMQHRMRSLSMIRPAVMATMVNR
jgi:hypothetical protein